MCMDGKCGLRMSRTEVKLNSDAVRRYGASPVKMARILLLHVVITQQAFVKVIRGLSLI